MSDKKDFGLEFLNFDLKYPLDLLLGDDDDIPEDLFLWIEEKAPQFFKFSFGFNENSRSFTCAITDRGSRPLSEKAPCLTQHGKSVVSALSKCYFLIEICGGGAMNKERISLNLGEREDYVTQQMVGLLRKTR